MIRPLLATALLLAGSLASAAPPDIPTIAPGRIDIEVMKDVTRTLSSDAFEGRAPGTPGEEKTLAYLAKEFAAAGLTPGGSKGSWFQDVPLMEITGSGFEPLLIRRRDRSDPDGDGDGAMRFNFGPDWVGVTFRPQKRVELRDSELVFVGYGIVAPEKGWNDYAGIDMKGKTAVILVNDPDYAAKGTKGPFGGRAMTYYGRWTYKFEEAAKQGAAAALIVHDTYPAAYGWSVVESGWSGPQIVAGGKEESAKGPLINGWVQKEVAGRILAAAGKDAGALMQSAQQAGFKPVPLGLTVSTGFDNAVRRFSSRNVIGLLPGTRRPEEYVLYTAHWDHLGRCPADKSGDAICNGAIDNATGTAALVALAKAQKAAGAPARSILFLALTAEESGLLGADYYAAHPLYPLNRTVGGVNMDALSLAGPARDVTVVGGGKSDLDPYLAAALKAEKRRASPDRSPEKGYYYRSDHFAFAKRGVPMFNVDGGQDLVKGGRKAGKAWADDYTTNRYHQPGDEYDPAWDWSGVARDLQLYYRLGRMLAETGAWPNWMPGDEFRRIRDESCGRPGGGC